MKLRQKPTGLWVVDYDCALTGTRRRVSTGCRDRAEATKRAREIVLGIDAPPPPGAQRALPGATGGITMRQLFDRCLLTVWSPREAKSQASIKSNLKVLERTVLVDPTDPTKHVALADLEVARCTIPWLTALKAALLAKGYAPGTVKRKMDTVGKALTMAMDWELITYRPKMPTVTVNNLKNRVLSEAEEAAAFAAIEARIAAEPQRPWQRFRILLRWLLDTGCRLGETLAAEPSWLDQHMGRAVLSLPGHATKSGKDRLVPLSKALIELVPVLRLLAIDGKLFPMGASTAWYMWTNIRADVKAHGFDIDDVTLHTMRHTCITRLIKGGLRIHLAGKWAGHADIKITMQRYAHLTVEELFEGADLMDAVPVSPGLRVVG